MFELFVSELECKEFGCFVNDTKENWEFFFSDDLIGVRFRCVRSGLRVISIVNNYFKYTLITSFLTQIF